MAKYDLTDKEINDILELIYNDIDEGKENNNLELVERMKNLYNKIYHQLETQ